MHYLMFKKKKIKNAGAVPGRLGNFNLTSALVPTRTNGWPLNGAVNYIYLLLILTLLVGRIGTYCYTLL